MKIITHLLGYVFITLMMISCNKGIDPITEVAPKPDQSAPEVNITFPVEGKVVRSSDEVATVTFKLIAQDDIELKSVVLLLNGSEIASYTSFKDYRRAMINYDYTNMTDGDYVLTVNVTDLTGKTASQTVNFKKVTAPTYNPLAGEVLYLPLDDNYLDLITGNSMEVTGAPTFVEGKTGSAYAGAADAFMSIPATGLLGGEFSVAFWYQLNPTPARGGILAISPVGDSRNFGLRVFRENSGDKQNIGLNFGVTEAEVWMNPFVQIVPEGQWMHIAITISANKATIYVDGQVVLETETTGPIDWAGCTSMTIGSGAPNFTYWEHFSDQSLYDEFHLFTKVLSAAEVLGLMGTK